MIDRFIYILLYINIGAIAVCMKKYGISVNAYSKFTQKIRIFHAQKNAQNRIYALEFKMELICYPYKNKN